MPKKNIFVLGLDDYNLNLLKRIKKAELFEFYALLDYEEIRGIEEYRVKDLLRICAKRIEEWRTKPDAIVGFFDFPVTDMVPILCKKYGLPSTSLESVLKCENKYWSRLEQAKVIPSYIPKFDIFDPFDDKAKENVGLLFPYWVKPIKSWRSYLAFSVNDENSFYEALLEMRKGVEQISKPFHDVMELASIPEEIQISERKCCIAESLLSGSMCTLEGYVHKGEVYIYGVVDSIRDGDRSSFQRYQYPSVLPESVQNEMKEVASKVMKQIDYNQAAFNMEFFYNQTQQSVSLLEVNPRISQSHAALFELVHGESHHAVMVELALGEKPDYELSRGRYPFAAKFMWRMYEDGVVKQVPSQEEIDQIKKEMPFATVEILVKEGVRLSELPNQDSYSYELAEIYLGAANHEELLHKYERCQEILSFEFFT
jgi:hypothetical protein